MPDVPLDLSLLYIAYAISLLLLALGLCGWCCCCDFGVPSLRLWRQPAQPAGLLAGLFPRRLGELHPDSPIFRKSIWRLYQDGGGVEPKDGDQEEARGQPCPKLSDTRGTGRSRGRPSCNVAAQPQAALQLQLH